jgi:hypothetical protein
MGLKLMYIMLVGLVNSKYQFYKFINVLLILLMCILVKHISICLSKFLTFISLQPLLILICMMSKFIWLILLWSQPWNYLFYTNIWLFYPFTYVVSFPFNCHFLPCFFIWSWWGTNPKSLVKELFYLMIRRWKM